MFFRKKLICIQRFKTKPYGIVWTAVGLAISIAVAILWLLNPGCWHGSCGRDEFDPRLSFTDYCEDRGDEYPLAYETVKILQIIVNNKDCKQAWQSLKAMNALYLDGRGIKSLAPLHHMTQITFLNLRKNSIQDLRPLSSMEHLASLKLESNLVTDIGPLQGLVALQSLDLSFNPLKDINALSRLHQLEILRLDDTTIEDISPLEGLIKLSRYDFFRGLSLTNTKAEREGFRSIRNCKSERLSPALRELCDTRKKGS